MPHPGLDAVHTSSTVCSANSRLGCEVEVWTYVLERPGNTPLTFSQVGFVFIVCSKRKQRNEKILATTQ